MMGERVQRYGQKKGLKEVNVYKGLYTRFMV